MEKLSISLTGLTYVSCPVKSVKIAKQNYKGKSVFEFLFKEIPGLLVLQFIFWNTKLFIAYT